MRYVLLFLFLGMQHALTAQEPDWLISRVLQAQKEIRHIRVFTTRHDTLVTGHIRTLSGTVNISVAPADRIFGFHFFAVPEAGKAASIYDGHYSFFIDHEKKEFTKYSHPELLDAITGFPGGQLVWKDLVRLDTSTATRFTVREDAQFYYLNIQLPDITRYDVTKRSKELTISKTNFLPVAMRQHQETLGKVQDLYYQNARMQLNEAGIAYDFSEERYPAGYQEAEKAPNKKLLALQGKPLPAFQLVKFDGSPLLSEDLKGKLVLLDFWEVWCGPCVASLPRIKELHEKYKGAGLEVIGIIHQTDHLKTARLIEVKFRPGFTMAAGNEKTRNDFSLQAVPLYILVNRKGEIVLVSEGFPEILEERIRTYL